MKTLHYLKLSIILFLLFNITLTASMNDLDDYEELPLSSVPIIGEKCSENDPQTEEQTQNSKINSNNSLSSSNTKKRKLSLSKDDSPQQRKKQNNNNNDFDPNSIPSVPSQLASLFDSDETIGNLNLDIVPYDSLEAEGEGELMALIGGLGAGILEEQDSNTNLGTLSKKNTSSNVNSFSVALLQANKSYEDALKGATKLKKYSFKNENINGSVYLIINNPKIQGWLNLILKSLKANNDQLGEITSINTTKIDAAVIFIEIDNRTFALPFGLKGRCYLDSEALEPDFGMKIALNTINPEKVKALGSHTIEYNARATLTSFNIPSDFSRFAVETHELVKKITAKVDGDGDNDSHMLSGTGYYVTKNHKLEIEQLPNICKKLLKQFEADDYKKKYSWFDNIRPVVNKTITKSLDDDLQKALKGESKNEWYLVKPHQDTLYDTFDSYYKIEGDDTEYASLEEIETLIKAKKYSIATLKSKKVAGYDDNGEKQGGPCCNLHKLLVFEAKHNNTHYILHEGHWFRLDPNYAQEIDLYIDKLFLNQNDIPQLVSRRKREKEGDYNSRIATASNNHLLLFDQRLVKSSTNKNSTAIEVCDLLSKDRQFIHIKGGTSSSNLSHLFAQGKVSGFVLNRDATFRNKLKDKFLKEEVILKMKQISKNVLKKIKDQWQEKMINKNWDEQMNFLMKVEEILGNSRNGKVFTKEDVEKSYNEEDEEFRNKTSFDDYIFKFYKDYLFTILRKKIGESCKLDFNAKNRNISLNNNLLKACKTVFGEKLITTNVQSNISKICEDYQILLDEILPVQSFNPQDYTIVYGISTDKDKQTLSSLIPFFSRVTLMSHAKELQSIGYKVRVKKINVL